MPANPGNDSFSWAYRRGQRQRSATPCVTRSACRGLILYGGYATGWAHREDSEGLRRFRAMTELARLGWGKDNPVFRQLFTREFVPDARPEQIEWFNELCRRTTTPEMAARLLTSRAEDQRALFAVAGSRADARRARAQR